MESRLHTLRRQQALLKEHLAWLETELAAEVQRTGGSPTSPMSLTTLNPLPSPHGTAPLTTIPAPPSPRTQPAAPVRSAPAPTAASTDLPAAAATTTDSAANPVDPDTLLASYADTARTNPADIRKGCMLYFGLALLIGILFVVAIYFIKYAKPVETTDREKISSPPTLPQLK